MALSSDVRLVDAELYFLPIETRVPLKFGTETLASVTCARARVRVEGSNGVHEGWGETPLSVQWVWPSILAYETRHQALKDFSTLLAAEWPRFGETGHAIEIGQAFLEFRLDELLQTFNAKRADEEPMPHLAALVCASLFDIALHDAYGVANDVPIYETYNDRYMSRDLSAWLSPAEGADVSFAGKYPSDYLARERPNVLPAWHLVGGKDPVSPDE
ncbi:MAG: hypothetical protein AAF517_18220, partial [Planctomycetota bacterium]